MAKGSVSIKKPQRDKVLSFASGARKEKAGPVPEGYTRLTVNMDNNCHMKLKLAAVKQGTTMGKLLENLVNKHISI